MSERKSKRQKENYNPILLKLLFNESQPPENSSDSGEDNNTSKENNFEIPNPQDRDELLERETALK